VTGNHPEITEVQAGSYIFMDQVYHRIRPEFGISLSVLCTVVSRPAPSRAILDGGLKTFSKGFELPEAKSCPGLRVAYLSEEHVNTQVSGRARDLKVGDKIELYTAHCCEAVNLHDRLYGVRRGRLEQVWDISARGRHT
jgi:D-serine deaminase-like pyridoxal phosphate-dependent protein